MLVVPPNTRLAAGHSPTNVQRRLRFAQETRTPDDREPATALVRAMTIAFVLTGSGCASILGFEGVRPVKAKSVAVTVEPSAITSHADQGGNSQRYFAAGFRYGVTDDIAVGARVGVNTRPELLARFQIVRPDERGVSFAFIPTFGAFYTADDFGDSVRVYSQPGFVLGFGDDWIVSPVVTAKLDITSGVSLAAGGESAPQSRAGKLAVVVTPIATIGAVVRVAKWLAVRPEVGVGRSGAYFGDGGSQMSNGVVVQLGIAMLLGGEKGISP